MEKCWILVVSYDIIKQSQLSMFLSNCEIRALTEPLRYYYSFLTSWTISSLAPPWAVFVYALLNSRADIFKASDFLLCCAYIQKFQKKFIYIFICKPLKWKNFSPNENNFWRGCFEIKLINVSVNCQCHFFAGCVWVWYMPDVFWI